MAVPAIGILPYGSTHPSVLLNCSLTSAASITSISGGAEVTAGQNEYDSELGMRALSATGGARFNTITGYEALDNAGQVSFEIETKGVAITSTAVPSLGNTNAGVVYVAVIRSSNGQDYMRMYFDANERLNITWRTANVDGGTNPSATPLEISSHRMGRFVRFTLSWIGNLYTLYIDGAPMFSGSRNTLPATNMGNRIEFMSGAGLGGNPMTSVYIRNLTISKEPVRTPIHPRLGKIAIAAHSYGTRAKFVYNSAYRNQSMGRYLLKYLADFNLYGNLPSDDSTIFDTTGATINDGGGAKILDNVALCVASNPTCAIYMGGVNDTVNAAFRGTVNTTFGDMKDHLISLLGASRTKLVVVTNVISTIGNTSNYASAYEDANVKQFNALIDTLPGWWDDLNPTRAGQLVIADVFSETGGTSMDLDVQYGSTLGTYNDLHPTGYGNRLHAYAWAKAIAKAINT